MQICLPSIFLNLNRCWQYIRAHSVRRHHSISKFMLASWRLAYMNVCCMLYHAMPFFCPVDVCHCHYHCQWYCNICNGKHSHLFWCAVSLCIAFRGRWITANVSHIGKFIKAIVWCHITHWVSLRRHFTYCWKMKNVEWVLLFAVIVTSSKLCRIVCGCESVSYLKYHLFKTKFNPIEYSFPINKTSI